MIETEPRFTLGPWMVSSSFLVVTPEARIVARCTPFELPELAVPVSECIANAQLASAAPELYVRLADLIKIIDAAGLLNLSNGVQLGQTSWYVKASERLELARKAVAKAVAGGNQASDAKRSDSPRRSGAQK